jgi:hypothetical protein
MPVTNPDEELIAAMDILLLAHVPPGVALLNAEVCPTQIIAAPVIVPGEVVIFTGVVL